MGTRIDGVWLASCLAHSRCPINACWIKALLLLLAAGAMLPAPSDWTTASVPTALGLPPNLSPTPSRPPRVSAALAQLLRRKLVRGWQGGRRGAGPLSWQTKGVCSHPAHFLGFHCRKLGTCQGDTDTWVGAGDPWPGHASLPGSCNRGGTGSQGCWTAGKWWQPDPHISL